MERDDLLYKSIEALREDVADFRQETNHRFDRIDDRFENVSGRLDNHSKRISSLETLASHAKWLVGIFITIFTALAAWVRGD